MEHQTAKKIVILSAVVAIALIMVWARVFYGSLKAYHRGESFLEKGHHVRAITFFDRSMHWYAPFNPYVGKSAERLWEIGNRAQEEGDVKLALIAFRTIKTGFHAAASFYSPGKTWIERCESRIAKLVMMEEGQGKDSGNYESAEKDLRADQKSFPPSIFWSIMVEIGFLGWIGSVIAFIMFVLRKKAEPVSHVFSASIWIGLIVVFFALWIVGMMRA